VRVLQTQQADAKDEGSKNDEAADGFGRGESGRENFKEKVQEADEIEPESGRMEIESDLRSHSGIDRRDS
jgi:hypothetical protein